MVSKKGRIPYRVRFIERPELNNNQFESGKVYTAGDVLEGLRDGLAEPTHAWAVIAIVPGRDGRPDTLVCDIVDRRDVKVSDAAATFARDRGGRIYVWAESFGSDGGWLQASTADPGQKREYERREISGIEVLVASDVAVPEIKVRLSVTRRTLVAESPGYLVS